MKADFDNNVEYVKRVSNFKFSGLRYDDIPIVEDRYR